MNKLILLTTITSCFNITILDCNCSENFKDIINHDTEEFNKNNIEFNNHLEENDIKIYDNEIENYSNNEEEKNSNSEENNNNNRLNFDEYNKEENNDQIKSCIVFNEEKLLTTYEIMQEKDLNLTKSNTINNKNNINILDNCNKDFNKNVKNNKYLLNKFDEDLKHNDNNLNKFDYNIQDYDNNIINNRFNISENNEHILNTFDENFKNDWNKNSENNNVLSMVHPRLRLLAQDNNIDVEDNKLILNNKNTNNNERIFNQNNTGLGDSRLRAQPRQILSTQSDNSQDEDNAVHYNNITVGDGTEHSKLTLNNKNVANNIGTIHLKENAELENKGTENTVNVNELLYKNNKLRALNSNLQTYNIDYRPCLEMKEIDGKLQLVISQPFDATSISQNTNAIIDLHINKYKLINNIERVKYQLTAPYYSVKYINGFDNTRMEGRITNPAQDLEINNAAGEKYKFIIREDYIYLEKVTENNISIPVRFDQPEARQLKHQNKKLYDTYNKQLFNIKPNKYDIYNNREINFNKNNIELEPSLGEDKNQEINNINKKDELSSDKDKSFSSENALNDDNFNKNSSNNKIKFDKDLKNNLLDINDKQYKECLLYKPRRIGPDLDNIVQKNNNNERYLLEQEDEKPNDSDNKTQQNLHNNLLNIDNKKYNIRNFLYSNNNNIFNKNKPNNLEIIHNSDMELNYNCSNNYLKLNQFLLHINNDLKKNNINNVESSNKSFLEFQNNINKRNDLNIEKSNESLLNVANIIPDNPGIGQSQNRLNVSNNLHNSHNNLNNSNNFDNQRNENLQASYQQFMGFGMAFVPSFQYNMPGNPFDNLNASQYNMPGNYFRNWNHLNDMLYPLNLENPFIRVTNNIRNNTNNTHIYFYR